MNLKVAMVTPWNVRCGVATYSEKLVNALVQLGVDVYVARLPRFGRKSPEILRDVAMRIPIDKIDCIHVQHEYGLYQNMDGAFYDVVDKLGKPVVSTMHLTGYNLSVDALISKASRRVIVHNAYCARKFLAKSTVIPHGCVVSESAPSAEAKNRWGIQPDAPIVGYLGFISQYKGLEELFGAMERIPHAGVLVAGGWHMGEGTQYMNDLKKRTLEYLPSRCQWIGYVPEDQLGLAYGAMEMVVYPSLAVSESGALLQALSYGKAVIARNLAPNREKGEAVLTFADSADLKEKIELLLKDENTRRTLEGNAKKYCMENSWEKVSMKHMELYEEVLAEKERA